MRPQSIVMFERLFLVSLVISALGLVLGFPQLADDPAVVRAGLGTAFLLGVAVVSYGLYLLLWYLIARRAMNWAKWVLVVFVALGLVSLPAALNALTRSLSLQPLINLAVLALEVVALGYLFRADAKAWLSGKGVVDPTTFE